MAVINIDDAYILGETGAQVDKVTGLFTKDEDTTSGEKAFAQLNIGTAGSNRNLLDNPWFTVNQRGLTTMSSASYAMDRWKCDNAITNGMVYSDGVVTLASNTVFAQRIEPTLMEFLKGKTVTASLLKADGTVVSATNVVNSSGSTAFPYVGGIDLSPIRFRVVGGVAIKAVKLELGSVSTLANDAPPKESQVTDDCKWYFQRIQQEDGYTAPVGFGIVTASTTILRTLIPLSSPLRKADTLTATATNIGQMRVQGNGSNLTPTAIVGRGVLNGHAVVDITVNGTLTANQVYTLVFANSTAIIDLSKDL